MTIAQIQTAINTDVTSKVATNSITPTNVGSHLAEQAAHSMTRAELLTAIAANELIPGALYEISDRGDRGLYFYAVKDNELSATGWRRMLCPARYSSNESLGGNDWKGVWNAAKTVVSGDLMIWGGQVWQNGTGAIGTAISFYELDNTNWTEITKTGFANAEYVELVFECIYDVANDYIAYQWDDKGNRAGLDFDLFTAIDGGANINYCNQTDWNFNANDDGYIMVGNEALVIGNNSNTGHIIGNKCPHGFLTQNSNTGVIQGNICMALGGALFDNSNGSDIAGNICDSIGSNSNTGIISGNKCFNISGNANTGGGGIISNVCGGNIITNTNVGDIQGNQCEIIDANTNNGHIRYNITAAITNNDNNGVIENNSNPGGIASNSSNVVDIQYNTNNGLIQLNTNTGDIEYNSNGGHIDTNSNTGYIRLNKNNGDITVCTGASNIFSNINNGVITGAHGADVSDAIVNK